MSGESISAHDEGASLLAHLGWIRRLARQLADDDQRAEDLVQDACVVALEARPRDPSSIRSWLRTVVQNLARQGGRGARNRRERELRAAASASSTAAAGETSDALLERAELQRRIVETVLQLDEPYRSTVLLRFFEDLPPREIARRQGVPATTVQSRLTRALQRLRERLRDDGGARDRDGARGAWWALLAPLSAPPRSLLTPKGLFAPVLGGWIVNAKTALIVLSLGAALTVAAILTLESPGRAPSPVLATDADSSPLADETLSTGRGASGPATERAQLGTAESSAVAANVAQPNEAAVHRVRGRVLDADGAPIGGLDLQFHSGDGASGKRGKGGNGGNGASGDVGGKEGEVVETRSLAGGVFELTTAASNGWIAAKDERLATVREGSFRATSSVESIVIVAPAIDVGGTVYDPERAPVQGAHVSLALPKAFGARFGANLERTRVVAWATTTDAAGHFTLPRVPQIAGSTVRVLVDGYEPAMQPEPELTDLGLSFVLRRPTLLAKGALRGRVLDHEGRPAAAARVAVGVASTVTGEDGEFALDLSRAVTADAVTAVKTGFRPARMERPDEPSGEETGWPDFVELRLGGPALSIAGQIVDAEKKPLPGMRVWIADPTRFGLIGRMPAQTENLMAGATIPSFALEPDPNPPKEDGDDHVVNRSCGGPPTAAWNWIETDEHGRFELPGLDERKYTLRVLDRKSQQMFTSRPIQAGDIDARIEMPKPELFAKLAGRVVTVGDRPVEGVRVVLRTLCFDVHSRYFGGKLDVLMMNESGESLTDADGRFEFKNVPREGVFFVLRSDRIVPCDWHMPAGADPEALDVKIDVRCQLDVRLKAPIDRADEISLLDGEGEGVDLIDMDEESVHLNSSVPLVDGRSGVLSASSSARVLQLRKNGEEIERRAIELAPDGVNVIEM